MTTTTQAAGVPERALAVGPSSRGCDGFKGRGRPMRHDVPTRLRPAPDGMSPDRTDGGRVTPILSQPILREEAPAQARLRRLLLRASDRRDRFISE